MQSNIKLVIAGVPEQVNLPIQLCIEQQIFVEFGLDIEYRIVPEGTGKLIELVESGEVDIAIMVTDGFIVGRSNGKHINLLGTYVDSPLLWAIAAHPQSSMDGIRDINAERMGKAPKYGISRRGSGSHTMAFYTNMKHELGAIDDTTSFVVANNFAGLRQGVAEKNIDVFLWETFTTKPYFDNGDLRKVGEVPTPWPAFVFVGSDRRHESPQDDAEFASLVRQRFYPAVAEGIRRFQGRVEGTEFIPDEAIVQRICSEFRFKPEDARLWLSRCRYGIPSKNEVDIDKLFAVDAEGIANAVDILRDAGLINCRFECLQLWDSNKAITFK